MRFNVSGVWRGSNDSVEMSLDAPTEQSARDLADARGIDVEWVQVNGPPAPLFERHPVRTIAAGVVLAHLVLWLANFALSLTSINLFKQGEVEIVFWLGAVLITAMAVAIIVRPLIRR